MKKLSLILACIPILSACADIFEKDLTNQTVELVSPIDGLTLEPGDVTFLWQEMEGATSYHLRVVGMLTVIDTVMHNDSTGVRRSYTCGLEEGDYTWSVVARNSEYETEGQALSFSVRGPQPVDISDVPIVVAIPYDGATLPPGEITFSWADVPGTEFYRFWLVSPNFDDASRVVDEAVLQPGDGVHRVTVDTPGEYQWKVRAGNDMFETAEYIFSFSVPETLPDDISNREVGVISPVNGAETEAGEVTFLWEQLAGATSYHLTVVSPSFADSRRVIVDSTMDGEATSYVVDNITSGVYEWKLTAANSRYRTRGHIRSFTVPGTPGAVDISEQSVDVVSPVNETNEGEVTFLWREVTGATFYHLTVVGPSFVDSRTVIVDRILDAADAGLHPTQHTATVPEGEYEWTVVAGNSDYRTREQIRRLHVIAPSEPDPMDISGQTVGVVAPVDGATTMAGNVTFLWKRVDGATEYHITVVEPSFAGARKVVLDRVLSVDDSGHPTNIDVNIPGGSYEWKVVATNSKYSTGERILSLTVTDDE